MKISARGTGNGGLTKTGGNTLTLQGPNTYSGSTMISGGVLMAGSLSTLSANSDMTVATGTLDATGYAQAIKSLTMNSGGVLNLRVGNLLTSTNGVTFAGTLNISGATGAGELMAYGSYAGGTFTTVTGLPGGYSLFYNADQLDISPTGTMPNSYSLVATASPLAIHVSTAGNQNSSTITSVITNTGSGLQDTLDYSGLHAGVSGGTITTATGGSGTALAQSASSTVTQIFQSASAGSFSLTSGVATATNHTLGGNAVLSGSSGTTVRVYNLAAVAASQTVNIGAFHVGTPKTATVTLSNTAPTDATYTETLQSNGFSNTSTNFTAAGLATGIIGGGSGSGTLLVGVGASLGSGIQSGTTTLALQSNAVDGSGLGTTSIGSQTIAIHATGYNLAAANSVTTPISLGSVHVGGTFGTQSLAITNTAASDGYSEKLDVSLGSPTGSATSSGSINLLASSATDNSSLVLGLGGNANTAAVGMVSGTVRLVLNSNGTGTSGLAATLLAGQTITIQGNVYSGQGVWATSNSGGWNNAANWSSGGGVPGIDGPTLSANDTAAFGSAANSGSVAVALGNTSPQVSGVTFSSTNSYALLQGSGTGVLTLQGTSGASVMVQAGSHAISVPVSLGSNTSVNTSFGTRLTISGNLGETTPGTSLTMTGAGKLTLAGSSNYTGDTAISSGTLEVNGPLSVAAGRVRVASGATLIAAASVPRAIAGAASDSAIVATAGNVTLGDSTSYTGFNHAGTLTIGSNAVTLNSAVFANLGVLTTLGGGTLAAPHGVYVGGGDNLVGSGVVSGKIAAVTGSTILATGNLTLGNSASSVGFNTEGELYTNANTVTLNDSNQAVLGSFTQIGDGESPGTLNAPNGIIVDTGKNLVGHGTMNSTNSLAKASIINGSVQATGSGLTLTGYIKGVGTYNGPVTFAGTYSPGLSPASVNLEDLILAPSSTLLMELGGMSPGSQYDVLNLSEAGMLDGTLEIDLIFGFMPSLGQTFDIINGTTTGHFSSFSLAPLPNGLRWNTSNLYSTGEISVVPEPSTLALFGVGGLGLMGWAWRRRTVKSKGQAREQERRDPAPHGKIPNPSGL